MNKDGVPEAVKVRFVEVVFKKKVLVEETRVVPISWAAVRVVPVAEIKLKIGIVEEPVATS